MGNTKAKWAATDTTMHDVPAKTMFRFRLRDLLLLTAWLSLCLSLGVCLELNTTGMAVAFVGCGLSIVGLLCGRLDREILAALEPAAPARVDDTGSGLTAAMLSALHPQERQILELVTVAHFPLPHDIVLAVFSEAVLRI